LSTFKAATINHNHFARKSSRSERRSELDHCV
jgi:hypothetical protein